MDRGRKGRSGLEHDVLWWTVDIMVTYKMRKPPRMTHDSRKGCRMDIHGPQYSISMRRVLKRSTNMMHRLIHPGLSGGCSL